MNRSLLSILLLALAVGCSGKGDVPPGKAPAAKPGYGSTDAPTPQDAAASAAPVAAVAQANIPSDAKYTIVCTRFAGGGHEQQARLAKEQLIRQTGRADFHVIHEELSSMLLYGYYRERDRQVDPVEAGRVENDLQWLRTLKSSLNERLFRQLLVIDIPTPDPAAPPEYDLTNLDRDKPADDPTRMFWTIVIASYTTDARDETGRPLNPKQLAVDVVREARAKGIPAYFYHGKNMSQVCVGAWPRGAIKEQEKSVAESRSESRANSGESLVVSPSPLPKKLIEELEQRGDVQIFQPKVEVLDSQLQATWVRYNEYAVNGAVQIIVSVDPSTRKETRKPQPSFLAEIPRLQPSLLSGGGAAPGNAAPTTPEPAPINPLKPGSGTTGRLKQVER